MKKIFLALLCFPFYAKAQYNITNLVTGLVQPVSFDMTTDGRFFVALKGGSSGNAVDAFVNVYDAANGNLLNTFWNFTDSTEVVFERGVLGVAIDPNFNSNHYVYVFYNHKSPARIRVVRFTEVNNQGTNPVIIFNYADPFTAGNHTGGNIHFRPSDTTHLYITLGDRATPANSQLLTNPCGKILRINKFTGAAPADNPFYDDGNPTNGNDDRIWAYGLRNSFDFCFSPINDSLYASENGQNTYDEVNQIVKGGNYGWPQCEGISGTCSNPNFIAPIEVWGSPLPAVTGIMVYNHSLMPNLQGHLLVADNDYGRIYDITLSNPPAWNGFVSRTLMLDIAQLTTLKQSPDGCILAMEGGYTSNGKIRKICPVGMAVNETDILSFSIIPNPATDYISINGNELIAGSYFELFDVAGKLLQNGNIQTYTKQLDVSTLSEGVYFIKVRSLKGELTQKFIIKR
jgi:glucose/arabinose dehydrogenase